MKTISLKLSEVYALHDELNGIYQDETLVHEGILKSKLSLPTRYFLNQILKQATEHKVDIDKARDGLILELGVVDGDGKYSLSMLIDGFQNGVPTKVPNPNWGEFQKKMHELFEESVEIKYKEFNIVEDLKDVSLDFDPVVLYKLAEN